MEGDEENKEKITELRDKDKEMLLKQLDLINQGIADNENNPKRRADVELIDKNIDNPEWQKEHNGIAKDWYFSEFANRVKPKLIQEIKKITRGFGDHDNRILISALQKREESRIYSKNKEVIESAIESFKTAKEELDQKYSGLNEEEKDFIKEYALSKNREDKEILEAIDLI